MSVTSHSVEQAFQDLVQADASMLSIPSRLEWVGRTAEFLKSRSTASGACTLEKADRLALALHEALTNAIVHGNLGVPSSLKEESPDAFARLLASKSADPVLADRRVGIRYCFDGKRCTIAITDQGAGFDHRKWIAGIESDEEVSPLSSGRGILMMRALVDQVEYRSGGREVELSVLAAGTGRSMGRSGEAWSGLAMGERLAGAGDGSPSDQCEAPTGAAAVMLMEQLRQSADDPRRQTPRVAFTTSVEIRTPGGEFRTAFSRDLSRGGIALVAPFELDPGEVEMVVPVPGRDREVLAARVVRCQRVTAGVYDIGCQFI